MASRGPISPEECLAAYRQLARDFGLAATRAPGRCRILGWDLEYVCAPALAGFIDSLLVRRLNDFVPDNERPRILDCGANIGFSVLNYKRQFPAARIVAFEPDPEFAPVLRRNLERNGAGDVEVVEAAAWIADGEAGWFCQGIDGSRLVPDRAAGPGTAVVRTVDLADYLADDVDLVKLDIEGAEYEVVEHLRDRLGKVKNLSLECHLDRTRIGSFGAMLALLTQAEFALGVNSSGPWRDLIRQPQVERDHWEQYLVVSAWRRPAPPANEADQLLARVGVQQLELEAQLRDAEARAHELRRKLLAAEKELRRSWWSRVGRRLRRR